MSSEKSDNMFADDSETVYDREFEDAFDLAFENAAAASTSVDKESMEASWHNVQAELQKMGRRKRRLMRWKLGGVIAASITLGATIFSIPAGLQADTLFVEKLEKMGDDFILSFTGKDTEKEAEDTTGALTLPPPAPSEAKPPEGTGLPEGTIISSHDLQPVTVSRQIALDGLTFVYHDFEVPFTPDKKDYQLLLDENNPVDPDNIYHSEELILEYYKDDENLLTIQINQKFNKNKNSVNMVITGDPEPITLEDGTAAIYYDSSPLSNFDKIAYRNNLVFVLITGTLAKEDMIATANAIQASNNFELKP
ncbi:hypothetical protein [Paenibacillus sp. Marseille-Q4541]|uniref:hypothetical protein n=1 Tax=Paenibacillus sp. Marseille-Q4541 TaxID=2831522 RepID=UPI001BAD8918|nr:hypothetical protein [Paenibacillus sp. Marseille-Q4541]